MRLKCLAALYHIYITCRRPRGTLAVKYRSDNRENTSEKFFSAQTRPFASYSIAPGK